MLADGRPRLNAVVTVSRDQLVVNTLPVSINAQLRGAVAMFRDTASIHDISNLIHEELRRRGLTPSHILRDIKGNSPAMTRPSWPSTARLRGRRLHRGQAGGKVGLFELANHGTIFLDEIGDISHNLQLRLLWLHVPPLRQRLEDIPLLGERHVDEDLFAELFRERAMPDPGPGAAGEAPPGGTMKEQLRHCQARITDAALRQNGMNRQLTARRLGISYNTLWRFPAGKAVPDTLVDAAQQ